MYLNAINSFSGSMYSLMDSIVDIRRFSDYYDSLDQYLNMPHKNREGINIPLKLSESPTIEFKDVSFCYPGQTTDVIKKINIVIKAGEKLSIVGENGAGKTTFIKLLLRLYKPTSGMILLNGVNIQDYNYDNYMKEFAVVFQDYSLFCMSLKENVSLSDSNANNDDMVKDILIKSGLESKISKLKNGVNTQIFKSFDETGFEPSGGEGQKIALARAIYKNSQVIILDEPTASLDPRAEYEIYNNFQDMVTGKTAIFISHRLASSKFCDKIAVFKNGEIIEYGVHNDLISKKQLYSELFEMQAQFYTNGGVSL